MYIERIAEDTHSLLAVDGHIPACGDNKDAWRWQWHCDCDLLDWCVFCRSCRKANGAVLPYSGTCLL